MPDDITDVPIEQPPADATELDALRAKLSATEQELHNYKLKLADFDNARKRMLRDAEVELKYAIEPLARALLSRDEIHWWNTYHAQVLAVVGPLVDGEAKAWLESQCRPL